MYSLRLFGGPSLEGPDWPIRGRASQPHQLALLALDALGRQGRLGSPKGKAPVRDR